MGRAQWSLKLSSNVYLRTWKLDTKASKEEKEIGGATIALFQNGKQINQTTSGGDGEFTIMVPKDGEFYLTVSFPGCNTKRMSINTQNVPEKLQGDNYKPTFEITGGFIMVKPYPGINYSELSQDLIRVEFLPGKKAFDDTEAGTERGLSIVSKIYAAEDDLFNKFCSTNKAGDVALAKPDCPLAKSLYEKAIALIPGEQYPVTQLAKVGLCLKDKEAAEKKAAEEAAAKVAAQAAADKKAIEEATAKAAALAAAKDAADKKAAEDAAAKTAAKEKDAAAKKEADDKKAIADAVAKANAEKAALIKEEEAKLAKANKEKAEKEKAENDKIAKQKAADEKKATEAKTPTQTASANQTPTEKKGDIKIKQKSPQQIEQEAKDAKKREGLHNSIQEDKDAMKADADKAKAKYEEKQKAQREKEEKQKEGLAKSKAEDEAAMKEAEAKKEAKRKEKEEKQKEGLAKSKAEDEAAMKADEEKREAKRRQQEEEEKERKKREAEKKENDPDRDKGDSDHSIPQVIGAAEKYRERIKAADELFKKKRYEEAKPVYEEALLYKEKDPYATSKLAEIQKLSVPK